MKILLDSNVALDAILKNREFHESASVVIGLSKGGVDLFVSASAVTDIYYLVCRETKSKKIAMSLLKKLLEKVDVAAVSGSEIRKAVNLDWGDFEDAVQYATGESIAVDYIVTRNKKDFVSSSLPVVNPDELLALLNKSK